MNDELKLILRNQMYIMNALAKLQCEYGDPALPSAERKELLARVENTKNFLNPTIRD